MAAKKQTADDLPIEAPDLIALLTPPGCDGCYEAEISIPEPGTELDLLAAQESVDTETTSFNQLNEILTTQPANRPTLPPNPTSPPKNVNIPEKIAISTNKAHPGTRLSPLPEIIDDSLEKIAAEIAQCTKCDLCKTRHMTVPGAGNHKARLVFIGEAPGADEDKTGVPFVGKAGQHLDKVLSAAGFKREEVFICNILKCRPPENRDPLLSEMLCCTPYLQRQLRIINPAIIACLGNVAVKFAIGPETPGITRVHGQWFQSVFGIPTMAMYHPSFLLRSNTREKGSPNWQMWQDIQALKKRYDTLG